MKEQYEAYQTWLKYGIEQGDIATIVWQEKQPWGSLRFELVKNKHQLTLPSRDFYLTFRKKPEATDPARPDTNHRIKQVILVTDDGEVRVVTESLIPKIVEVFENYA